MAIEWGEGLLTPSPISRSEGRHMGVKESIGRIRKAIAVAVAGVVVVLLGKAGVVTDVGTVEVLVTFGITSALTYLVPNSKGYLD